MTTKKTSTAIDQHIAGFPAATQKLLNQLRATIRKHAPDAEESINYGVPTFSWLGNLVHFAGYKNHIGFYPGASPLVAFKSELSVYKTAKGSIQFPLDQALPTALIARIVKFRLQENKEKAEEKAKKKSLRTCAKGHQYYKSSDCPTCPICETERKPKEGFLSLLSNPARRALEKEQINTLKKLAKFTEAEILSLHGIGPASMPRLRKSLKDVGLAFKK